MADVITWALEQLGGSAKIADIARTVSRHSSINPPRIEGKLGDGRSKYAIFKTAISDKLKRMKKDKDVDITCSNGTWTMTKKEN